MKIKTIWNYFDKFIGFCFWSLITIIIFGIIFYFYAFSNLFSNDLVDSEHAHLFTNKFVNLFFAIIQGIFTAIILIAFSFYSNWILTIFSVIFAFLLFEFFNNGRILDYAICVIFLSGVALFFQHSIQSRIDLLDFVFIIPSVMISLVPFWFKYARKIDSPSSPNPLHKI
jgi:hypothetical protein